MEPRLAFENVDKRYGRVLALDALSLSVEPGEIFGFLGPNGAGKSTAIHVAMGFLQPSSGRGTLLGLPFGRARAARSRTGYVPDAPAFFAGSPLAAVLAAAELNSEGKPLRGLREHARELLRMLDLPGSDDTPKARDARKLSRGQQQRLAIAQALITRPDLLVLDEPTSALDPPAVLLVREVLEQARNRGAAVFFSSHQLQEVELLCDRAAFLDEGRLLQSGTMAELLQEGTLAHITLRGLTRESPFVRHNVANLQDSTLGRGMRASMRGDLVFAVPVPEQQRFLEHAWVAGAELVALSRTRRTLEQLFAQRRQRAPEQRLEQEG